MRINPNPTVMPTANQTKTVKKNAVQNMQVKPIKAPVTNAVSQQNLVLKQNMNPANKVAFQGWFSDLWNYFPKKLEQRREDKKAEQFKKIEKTIHDDVTMIAKRQGIPIDLAKQRYENWFNGVAIPLKNDGKEEGLNKVIGYSYEKFQVMKELFLPLMAKEKWQQKESPIPNGMLFYGPKNSGKTHFVQAMGEHIEKKNLGEFKQFMPNGDTKNDDPLQMYQFFLDAENRYKETGKRQILFIDDMDELFDDEERPDVTSIFNGLTRNCAQKGITWVGTSNSPKRLSKDLFKPTRLNADVYIKDTSDAEKSAVMSYFWKQNDRKDDSNHDQILTDYKASSFHFYPPEMKSVACQANDYMSQNVDTNSRLHSGKEKKPVTTDVVKTQINNFVSIKRSENGDMDDYITMNSDSYRDYVKEKRGEMKNA